MIQYQIELKNSINKHNQYHKQKKEWLCKIQKYETKLHNIINNMSTRFELIEYILNHFKNEIPNNIQKIIKILLVQQYIYVPIKQVALLKNDKSNIFYWLTRFKDYKLDKLLQERPTKPTKLVHMYPYIILKRLSPLRFLFYNNNKNIKYYIIKITLNNIYKSCNYKHNGNKWIYRRRDIYNTEPISIPC